jgi:hypothetical protein
MSATITDYELTPADKARIQCTAPASLGAPLSRCGNFASYAQHKNAPPFWYHCAEHAEMWRKTGKVYTSNAALISSPEQDARK